MHSLRSACRKGTAQGRLWLQSSHLPSQSVSRPASWREQDRNSTGTSERASAHPKEHLHIVDELGQLQGFRQLHAERRNQRAKSRGDVKITPKRSGGSQLSYVFAC